MRLLLLIAFVFGAVGCSVPKGQGTLDRIASEAAKPAPPPPGELTEAQIGLPFYPGAKQGISDKVHEEAGMRILEVALTTKDSPDQVRAFYEKEIGAKAMPLGTPGFYSIQRDQDGRHVEVDYARFDDEVSIKLRVTTPEPGG